MSSGSPTIPPDPVLTPAEDYYALRREGIGRIARLGSAWWTDYNTHDPGITLLDALCFAITDLAYRTNWEIADLLTTTASTADDPYPLQAFFTARRILTMRPWTAGDFRRVLIDQPLVRNAWVFARECACETDIVVSCREGKTVAGYTEPEDAAVPRRRIAARGLYDVLLELERDAVLGDLNDRVIERRLAFLDGEGRPSSFTAAVHFPADLFVPGGTLEPYREHVGGIIVRLTFLGTDGAVNWLDLPEEERGPGTAHDLRRYWDRRLVVAFTIEDAATHAALGSVVTAALRLSGDASAADELGLDGIRAFLEEPSSSGHLPLFREKERRVAAAVAHARDVLHAHRNLSEDVCSVDVIGTEDVAVCADVDVAPDADIEQVLARIRWEMEDYCAPPVRFRSLDELRAASVPVEEIFNGPALEHGFLTDADLAAAGLVQVLRVSDLLARLMAVDGVIAVRNLLLTKYDADGRPVAGAADPAWVGDALVFDPARTHAAWELHVAPRHHPRPVTSLSRIIVYKNGLPFLPDEDEAADVLHSLREGVARGGGDAATADITAPRGRLRAAGSYRPVQYSLPRTYGVGEAGLPADAPAERKAQARQLQGYLMMFEQLLANAHAQLEHAGSLFSLDPDLDHTVFTASLDSVIGEAAELLDGLTDTVLQNLAETNDEFLSRRNRVLDHVLARFGERYPAQAPLTHALPRDRDAGREERIASLISFIQALPRLGAHRAAAIDYRQPAAVSGAIPLIRRVALRTGAPDLVLTSESSAAGVHAITLRNTLGKTVLTGTILADVPAVTAGRDLRRLFIATGMEDACSRVEAAGGLWRLTVASADGRVTASGDFASQEEAGRTRYGLIAWCVFERTLVIEHVLLRPKYPGDALPPSLYGAPCDECCDLDPYSFRLTIALPGWTLLFRDNIALRAHVERSLREEAPSHLMLTICWVGNDGFDRGACNPLLDDLAAALRPHAGADDDNTRCTRAAALLEVFTDAFAAWYDQHRLTQLPAPAIEEMLRQLFERIGPDDIDTAPITLDAGAWEDIRALVLARFLDTALTGWQFERLEHAWWNWLEVNAAMPWLDDRLRDIVRNVLMDAAAAGLPAVQRRSESAACADAILRRRGDDIVAWLRERARTGVHLPFTPAPVEVCGALHAADGTAERIEELLADAFDRRRAVSEALGLLLERLAATRSVFPAATLHDCEEGGDDNPVRLNRTTLGVFPVRSSGAADGGGEGPAA